MCPGDRLADAEHDGRGPDQPGRQPEGRIAVGGHSAWSDSLLIPCADNKWRRVPGRRMGNTESRGWGECGHEALAGRGGYPDRSEQDDGCENDLEIEPALFPLADGIPNRVGLLRGAGNAICPQVAAVFVQCAIEAMDEPVP